MQPLGFDWHISVGIVSSFANRELFISSMALLHSMEQDHAGSRSLAETMRGATDPQSGEPLYNTLTALSLLVFFAFSCQCISTIAVCRRETGHWKWPALMFVYMTSLAYLASLLTYQLGSLLVR